MADTTLARRPDTRRESYANSASMQSFMRIQPWSVGIQPDWTVSEIRSVLRQHEQGTLHRSALLVDAMGRDDRIPSVLRHRVRGLLSFPFAMEPSDETEMAKGFATEWADEWEGIAPAATLARLLMDYIMLGVGIGQIAWDRKAPQGLMPTLYREHPSWLRYDETQNQYFYQTRAGEELVTPGDGRWVLLEAGERGYQNGGVRALAMLWLIRHFAWRDWARYSERHGMPIIKAMHPAEIDDPDRDEWWDDLIALGTETTVMLAQGSDGEASFDLSLLEAKDRSWESFPGLKGATDSSIAIYLLGQNLTTEVDAGSFAAASVHKNVKAEVLGADEHELSTDLYAQLVVPVSGLLRPGGQLIAPHPHWNTTPPADKKLHAETAKTLAETLTILQKMGLKVEDIGALGREHGLELRRIEPDEVVAGAPLAKLDRGDKAFAEGQAYIDNLTGQQSHEAGVALAGDLETILKAIEGAETFDEVQEQLEMVYAKLDPLELAEMIADARVVANLNGMHAVAEEF